jgi:quercetin dioxygenase-like cupin family protein
MSVRVVTDPDPEVDAANANRQHFELLEGQAFLIPEGYVHQYLNLTDKEAVFFFGIGSDF